MLSWRRSCDSVSTVASPQLCLVDLSPSVLNDRAQPADCTGQHVTAAGTQQESAYSLQARGTHRWTPTEWTDSCAAAVGHLGSHVLTANSNWLCAFINCHNLPFLDVTLGKTPFITWGFARMSNCWLSDVNIRLLTPIKPYAPGSFPAVALHSQP